MKYINDLPPKQIPYYNPLTCADDTTAIICSNSFEEIRSMLHSKQLSASNLVLYLDTSIIKCVTNNSQYALNVAYK